MIPRFRLRENSLTGHIYVMQTNPGEDCNAVLLHPEDTEFVLLEQHEREVATLNAQITTLRVALDAARFERDLRRRERDQLLLEWQR